MRIERKGDHYRQRITHPSAPPPQGGLRFLQKGPAAGGLLTCWVKAACGDAGDLLGAPRELSGLESQGRSFDSVCRGVCAKPKPSSASAMVCPAPCARAGSCSEDRKQRERGREREKKVGNAVLATGGSSWAPSVQLPAPPFPAEGGCRRSLYYYHYYYFMTTHNLLRKTRVRPGGGEARISPAQAPHDKPAARQICLDFWKSQ